MLHTSKEKYTIPKGNRNSEINPEVFPLRIPNLAFGREFSIVCCINLWYTNRRVLSCTSRRVPSVQC